MRELRFLLSCFVALLLSFSAYGSTIFNRSQTTNIPAKSIDLGIRVVSSIANDGTVTTTAIGRADDASFMATFPNAKPLYLATGNLIINNAGSGYIASPTEMASGSNKDLFGWADITGRKTSMNLNDYPSIYPPAHISGNSAYDIARVKLGNNWRLPTVDELVFLIKNAAQHVTTNEQWSPASYSYGTHSLWQNSPTGMTITSKVVGFEDKSIFLPAVGYRDFGFTTVAHVGIRGYYWSGTRYSTNNSYYLNFSSDTWSVSYNYRGTGFAVRPVSE